MHPLIQLAADRIQLFLSPSGQPHAILPTCDATPIYSEQFFTYLVTLADTQQTDFPTSAKLAYDLRRLNSQAEASRRTQPVPLRTFKPDPETLLIDLQENLEAIELTRKGWKITANFDAPFLRPTLNYSLPIPEPPKHDLPTYLAQLFEINQEPAQQLAMWLAQALLPDGQPPILVITGKARDAAATKLRTIIDPVPQALFPLPSTTNQLGQLALTNRVLAFAAYGPLTQKKKVAFNTLSKGMPIRLKEVNKRGPQIFTTVSRPIIITSETPQEIGDHQITIEINKANPGDHPQILGALLDFASAALAKSPVSRTETIVETKLPIFPPINTESGTRGP